MRMDGEVSVVEGLAARLSICSFAQRMLAFLVDSWSPWKWQDDPRLIPDRFRRKALLCERLLALLLLPRPRPGRNGTPPSMGHQRPDYPTQPLHPGGLRPKRTLQYVEIPETDD